MCVCEINARKFNYKTILFTNIYANITMYTILALFLLSFNVHTFIYNHRNFIVHRENGARLQ